MNLPDPNKKVEQHNFATYKEAREWLQRNGFQDKGCLQEEPWASFFVSRWEKENFVALQMNISFHPNWHTLPLSMMDKPYQVDVSQLTM